MKKFIKRALKVGGVLLLLLIGAIVLIPMIFGNKIKMAVKDYVNEQINAVVYFDDIGVSVFKNFPNVTASLSNFGVVGKEEFAGDTLVDVKNFSVVVDIMSLFGEEYVVKKVALDQPTIYAKVLRDGKANWDIMKTDSSAVADTAVVDTTPSKPLKLKLAEYSVKNANLTYLDKSSDMYLRVVNLNHSGSGDFDADSYDFDTETTADSVTFEMEGTNYLNKGSINADITININTKENKYTLKENSLSLNDLTLKLDGWLVMGEKDYTMDFKFGTTKNTFKNILSMVPGMYTADFKDINTDGTFTLDGNVTGVYNENRMPGFNVNLAVVNGYFKYPDLPKEVKDINFDVKVNCADGNLDNLKINMPKFHCLFGSSPIDAKLVLSGITSMNLDIDASVKASMNLEEVMAIYPMEGQELKGAFSIDATAKGKYNEKAGTFPTVNASMKLLNGYYKTVDFPAAIDKMSMDATMKNENGSLAATFIEVKQFHAEVDGEPLDATLTASNLEDVNYNLKAHGNLDLEKLMKIYPLENTVMKGKVKLDIETSGKQSDVMAERYMNLPTSGSMELKDFFYSDADIPQGVGISDGHFTFTPSKLVIDRYKGTVGHSPVSITGSLDNYLAFALVEDQLLTGTMSLTSPRFDVNEWMVETEEVAPATGPTAPPAATPPAEEELYVYEVPANINFTFDCSIGEVLYDNMVLKDVKGRLTMKDREVRFEQLNFNLLGGAFRMTGGYNTKDITKPLYDLNMSIASLDIQKAYETFNTVKALAPVAKFVNGRFSTNFNMAGVLGQDMYPDLATLTSVGDALVFEGKVANMPILDAISEKTKLANFKSFDLKDIKMLFEVKDGRFKVQPFDVNVGNTKMKVAGSNGLDGGLDYNLNLDIPAGAAGQVAASALSSLSGRSMKTTDKINIDLGLGGTFDKPRITSVGGNSIASAEDVVEEVKEEVKEQVEEKVEEVKEEVKEQIDNKVAETKAKILADAQAQADKVKAEAKKRADQVRAEANKRAADVEKSAKNPLEKQAKKIAADKIRKEGEDSAKKIESEAAKQADNIMSEARKKADAVK
jgi:hypothetical protein